MLYENIYKTCTNIYKKNNKISSLLQLQCFLKNTFVRVWLNKVNHLCSAPNIWFHSKQMALVKVHCITRERIRSPAVEHYWSKLVIYAIRSHFLTYSYNKANHFVYMPGLCVTVKVGVLLLGYQLVTFHFQNHFSVWLLVQKWDFSLSWMVILNLLMTVTTHI